MKNEISKRAESRVLYEPPEPLFSDIAPRRKIRLGFAALIITVILLAVCVPAFAAGDRGAKEEHSFGNGASNGSPSVEETESVPAETEGGVIFEDEQTGLGSESATESTGDTTQDETSFEAESESESGSESDPLIADADLSQIDKGEHYVINYTDRAVDVVGLIDRGFIEKESAGGSMPLVLVIHTHTSEEYMASEHGFKGPSSVVSAGEAISATANLHGVPTVHCTVIHDKEGEDPYRAARDTVETMLEIYPSIKYVIDLHRLSLYSDGLPIRTASGCGDGSAQVRLTVGASEGVKAWREGLSLALELRKSLNKNGERVCMPVVISDGIPNADMGIYYLTVDIGSVGNTVDEAIAAGKRLGIALADALLE